MNGSAKQFAARWSLSVWIITLAVIAIVIVATGSMIWRTPREPAGIRWLVVASCVALPAILGITILFAPLGYVVLPSAIIVKRIGPNLTIGYQQIAAIRRLDCKEIGFVIRVFGSGGFFGWFGWFHGSRLGWFRACGSSQDQLVLITRTDGTKIVISPHPADAFLEAVSDARQR